MERANVRVQLTSVGHLPLVPLSDGRIVSLRQSSTILSMAEASKNMQMVCGRLNLSVYSLAVIYYILILKYWLRKDNFFIVC